MYRLYRTSPAPIRAAGDFFYRFIPERFLRSKQTRHHLAELEASQWWDETRLEAWRLEKLRDLLMHAGTHVPYYRELFGDLGFKPTEITGFSDLSTLPILTIHQLRELGERLLPDNIDRSTLYVSASSGSTGHYHEVLRDASFYAWEQAFLLRYLRWYGMRLRWRHAIFYRAIMEMPVESAEHPPYERFRNRLILSQFHTDEKSLDFSLGMLADFTPDFLTVFPTTLLVITRYCRSRGMAPPFRPRFIVCYSENLYEEHRIEMEAYWGCPIYNRYGHNEGCISAGSCTEQRLHLSAEMGHTEILRADGTPAAAGEQGRVIATGFFTHAMPLIRYDTRDMATLSTERCPCGRTLPVLESVDGRADDLVRTRDGKVVAALRSVFAHTEGIRLTQIVQEVPGEIIIRIVPDAHFTDSVQNIILENLHHDLGGDVLDVRFELVDDVERSPSGKIRLVLSRCEVGGPED